MKGSKLYNGRYILHEHIASGGFAYIYRATETGRPEDVAIKICSRHNDPAYARSIVKEAELIQRFNHRNIVKLHPIPRQDKASVYYANAVDLPQNPPFFVMEYLSGGTLEEYLEKVGPLPPEEAATIGVEVARALDHIHQKKYAHNDLKLENILFRRPVQAGQPFAPVLVDFGIATRVAPPQGGSLYIMSPEQLAHIDMAAPELHEFDPIKVDVWGLGVVLYRTLGGHLPFESRNERTLTDRIKQSRPTSLRLLSKNISAELDKIIIDGCLAKNPTERLTLLELGRELSTLAGRGVPASKSADVSKPKKRGFFG